MKKIYITILGLFAGIVAICQPLNNGTALTGKIKLDKGQKIVVETSTDITASLIMGMELTSNSINNNSLEVKNSTDKNYTISNTLTKIKVNMNMAGQPYNYDSENKDVNNDEMAKIFDNSLNNPVDILIDNTTGMAITEKKKTKKDDTEESNPATDLMKMFSDNSDDAIVSGAFEIIPQGKAVGDSWADTATAKDMKMIRTYTLKSVTANEAIIQVNITAKGVNKLDFQGMEFEIKSETKSAGEIITDISTGLVKKRTNNADISGTIQMMGQDMPITATTKSTIVYK